MVRSDRKPSSQHLLWKTIRWGFLSGVLAAVGYIAPAWSDEEPVPADLVWQLGVADGKSAEFLTFKTGHFTYNRDMAAQPGWNAKENSFHFAVTKPGIDPKPLYPAGISGPTSGTRTWCQRETIVWTDDGRGWRVLEIPLLDSHTFDFRRTHHGIDSDANDWAHYSLRVAFPDGQVTHTYLPYDLAAYEKANGQVVVRAGFRAQAGENRLELFETSGSSIFRNYHFDYIRVARTDQPSANPPTVEIETGEGFSHHTIYDWRRAAELDVKVYNLRPGDTGSLRMAFRDFFRRTVTTAEQPIVADASGRASATFPCPNGVAGHLRATAELLRDGQPLGLQTGGKEVMHRLCAVRTIAPLSDEEIERSIIGLCGLSRSGVFDVYSFRQDADRKDEVYRQFRRTLQIHNERYHSLCWAHLEPKENEFRWEYWDKVFAKEKEERIRLQLGVIGTPEWLLYRHYPERKKLDIHKRLNSCPPDMEKWGDVCAKIAARYRGQIADFEPWNEPSEYSLYWYKASAEDYFNLVKYAALGVRRVAPEINIVAETVWARQPEFYQELYRLGVAQYVDYPADHYMDDSRIRLVNRFLDQVNGSGKGLINNEDYSPSCGRGGENDEADRHAAARKLLHGIIRANACGVKRTYEFTLVSPSWGRWGFLGPTQEPRYSFASLKTLVNRTTGAEFQRSLDLGDGLEGYVYHYFDARRVEENGGDHALFLFNLDSASRPLRLYVNRPSVTVVDLMDNAREIETKDGLLAWELGADPIVVIGADPVALEKQDALRIEPVAPSAKPGQALRIELGLAPGQDGPAEVTLDAGELVAAPVTVAVAADRVTPLELPLRADLPEGVYPLEFAARIPGVNGPIPVYRRVAATVARVGLGENHFASDTFADASGEWKAWHGNGRTSIVANAPGGLFAARVDLEAEDGVVGWSTAKPMTVIPGARYHVMFRARGQGLLRLLQKKHLDDGDTQTVHNLHNGRLGADWRLHDCEWIAPPDVRSIDFSLYLWHDVGWFEVTDFRLIRIPADQPINRLLYTAVAQSAGEVKVDGRLDEWPEGSFVTVDPSLGVRMDDYGGPEDSAARFAVQWREQTLYLAVVVTDDTLAGGPDAHHVYEGDSVQLDFEIDNRKTKSPTAQLSVGLVGGKPAVFRHRTIPTEDIVPSYVTGPDPEGVSAAIRRDGNQTVYEIAVAGRAVCPTFRMEKGRTVAFSLLVNDNDGAGRKGWLEWSSGIGGMGGSVLFGSLSFE